MFIIITDKKILSNLSSIPPWLLNRLEKSFKFKSLLIYEK